MSDAPPGEPGPTPAPGAPAGADPAGEAPAGAPPGGEAVARAGGSRALVQGSASGRFALGDLLDERSAPQVRAERTDRADDTQHGLALTWEDSDSHFRLRTAPSTRIAARRAARSGAGEVLGTAARAAAAGAAPAGAAPEALLTATDTASTSSTAAAAAAAVAEEEAPRAAWVVWLLVAALAVPFLLRSEPPTPGLLDSLGALRARDAWGEPWRLVQGLFVHGSPWVLVVSSVLVLTCGADIERRRGPGVVLGLFVGLGALLDAVRCAVEPARSLLALAGAWPSALALGGAALGLSVLAPRGGAGRGPGRIAVGLVINVLFLALLADQAGVWGPALQASFLLAGGVGLVAGLLLSLVRPGRPDEPSPLGCGLGGAALLAFLAAQGASFTLERRGPPPLPPGPGTPASTGVGAPTDELPPLGRVRLDELAVTLDVPDGWTQVPQGADAKGSVLFDGPGPLFAPAARLRVSSRPKGPFDAPDTLAARIIADLGRGSAFLEEPELLEDRPFEGAAGKGYLVALRGSANGQRFQYRIYLFVGPKRELRADAWWPDEGDAAGGARTAALVDAVARTLREVE